MPERSFGETIGGGFPQGVLCAIGTEPVRTVSFPVRYSYRSRNGESSGRIIVTLHYIDCSGRAPLQSSVWEVQ